MVLGRAIGAARAWSTFVSSKFLKPSHCTSNELSHHFHALTSLRHRHVHTSFVRNQNWPYFAFPAVLAGLIGAGLWDVAHADADEASNGRNSHSKISSCDGEGEHLEEIARKERIRIQELLERKGIQPGSYPRFAVAVKGQKVTIRFQVPLAHDIPQLVANLISKIGLKVDEHGGGAELLVRAWESAAAWQLTLRRPEDDLCILLFRSIISSDKAEIEFIKQGSLSTTELDALISALQLAGGRSKFVSRKHVEGGAPPSSSVDKKSLENLESMGVKIYGLGESLADSSIGEISWDNIAGYDEQKREVEDTILLALHSPDLYDDIARATRCKFESNRPRAVLFDGPPGTGKTSCARVIAKQARAPLLYVPLEVVMSKYYGESERLLGEIFSLANELSDGAIIFLDEVDSLAVARDSNMHEATRRILSVLLRQIDGFEQDKKVLVIAATNRKQDLDPALISRFDMMISFELPDPHTREKIAAQYAKHLKKSELEEFASCTDGMSPRDIKDVCLQAERSWASKILRGKAAKNGGEWQLPPIPEYIASVLNRQKALHSVKSWSSPGKNLQNKSGHIYAH